MPLPTVPMNMYISGDYGNINEVFESKCTI